MKNNFMKEDNVEHKKIDTKRIVTELKAVLVKENLSVSDAIRMLEMTESAILCTTKLK